MAETITSLIAEAKKNKYSLMPNLLEEDILKIWESMSEFIISQLQQYKGVCIQGFGRFTFSQRKVDAQDKEVHVQRPVFILAEKYVQTHLLHYPRQYASGETPVVRLNYTVLSNGTMFDRDTVEVCIREIFLVLNRAIAADRSVSLDFPHIGRLIFKDKKVRMRFFKGFVQSMDKTGQMEKAFKPQGTTRPSTEGSLMSDPNSVIGCPFTRVLPKINEEPTSVTIPSVNQVDDTEKKRPPTPYQSPRSTPDASEIAPTQCFENGRDACSDQDGTGFVPADNPSTRPNTCSHSSLSQGLCYPCHQRALRNIPISLEKERKERELFQDKLLHIYQQRKASLAIATETAKLNQDKKFEQEAANFNLKIANERKQQLKAESLKNLESYPSCLIHRSQTPCYSQKQLEYCHQLDQQVKRRRNALERINKQERELEKQQQQILAKELALVEEAFATRSATLKVEYHKALDDQVKAKLQVVEQSPPAQPIFGVYDAVPAKMAKEKEKYREIFKHQLATVANKQELLKSQAMKVKAADEERLQKNKQELLNDLIQLQKEKIDARKELELSWKDSGLQKKERLLKELQFNKQPGILVQEQCMKYQRCKQCQRKREHAGRSNILSESRYISGSRLMV